LINLLSTRVFPIREYYNTTSNYYCAKQDKLKRILNYKNSIRFELNLSRIKANFAQIKLNYLRIVFEFDNALTKQFVKKLTLDKKY